METLLEFGCGKPAAAAVHVRKQFIRTVCLSRETDAEGASENAIDGYILALAGGNELLKVLERLDDGVLHTFCVFSAKVRDLPHSAKSFRSI